MTPPPPSSASKPVLRSLYRSLLRAAAPFSHPSPSAAAYASLIHRSGVSHDWEECVHKLENNRRRVAAAAASRSGGKNKNNNSQKENILPRSWARNLSRSYSDLQEEYASRKDYFELRYGVDVDDDDDDWDDDDENAMDLAVGSSSYYTHNEVYIMEEDPKFVLFRHLLHEWFAASADARGNYTNSTEDCDTGDTEQQWPRHWSPKERGYYQDRKIKQVPLMKFPSQIASGNAGPSLRSLIRTEFRSPTVEERLMMESSKAKEEAPTPDVNNGGCPRPAPRPTKAKEKIYPSSSYVENETRIQTAFHTLNELNRKLAWAENLGFPPVSSDHEAAVRERKSKRLVQAAKGVTHLSRYPQEIESKKAISQEDPMPTGGDRKEGDKPAGADDDDDNDTKKSSSPLLQCGTYLIAHPLMTGYFAKSVIVILDHAEELNNSSKTEEGSGGTYGLIINRLALQPEIVDLTSQRHQWEILRQNWEEDKKKSQMKEEEQQSVTGRSGNDDYDAPSNNRQTNYSAGEQRNSDTAMSSRPDTVARPTILRRPISLLQAMQDLPETVQMAFGDVPVREGGPVNLSLQMIHRKNTETMNENEDNGSIPNSEKADEEKNERHVSISKIGGTPLPGADQNNNKLKGSEESIYFRGDVIEASYEVLDGRSDIDDFSFIIGAACWAPGQLVNEIERGCWLPFHGPPQMTMTGIVDHNDDIDVDSSGSDDSSEKGATTQFSSRRPSSNTTLSVASQQQSGQPVMRPVGDLWLSIMCALGSGEADLAYMMLDNKNVTDPLGDACDNFDR